MTQERFGRRFIALIAVLVLHFVFLFMLLAREPSARMAARSDRSSVLFFIDASRSRVTTSPSTQTRTTQRAPAVIEKTNTAEQTAITPAAAEPPATIDWNAQAAEAAEAVVDKG